MEALAPGHVVVIAVVAGVLFFGWRQLPDMSRSLGRSIRIFRTEVTSTKEAAAVDQTRTAARGAVTDTMRDVRGVVDAATDALAGPVSTRPPASDE